MRCVYHWHILQKQNSFNLAISERLPIFSKIGKNLTLMDLLTKPSWLAFRRCLQYLNWHNIYIAKFEFHSANWVLFGCHYPSSVIPVLGTSANQSAKCGLKVLVCGFANWFFTAKICGFAIKTWYLPQIRKLTTSQRSFLCNFQKKYVFTIHCKDRFGWMYL